jgi:hypothetical protein
MYYAVKRPLLLLASAGVSVSAGAGLYYYGDDRRPAEAPRRRIEGPGDQRTGHTQRRTKTRRLAAASKHELGLQQSLARELACWMSSASVAAARQALATAAKTADARALGVLEGRDGGGDEYRELFSWLRQLTPATVKADARQILAGANFSSLLDLLSAAEGMSVVGEDLERRMQDAVGVLASNGRCAAAIAEKATRYGRLALVNLAHAHDDDSRVGDALHRLVVLDSDECRFGPANLVSLLSLAVADVPDEYLEFALWGLSKAASPEGVSNRYKWRKTLFGDDSTAKTRRKLISNGKLWTALLDIGDSRSDAVQLQAARLLKELSDDPSLASAMQRHKKCSQLLTKWLASPTIPLACSALDTIASLARTGGDARRQLVSMGVLDMLRTRILENGDCRMTAKLLNAVHALAEPERDENSEFVLDQDSLSFVGAIEDDDPLEQDDLVNPSAMASFRYVDGWIELFTEFMKNNDQDVRDVASKCLQQIVTHGTYKDQGLQEWLIAVLDGVLDKIPKEIAASSTSVRDARSRTRPLVGHQSASSQYEASHAKALRALAFVAEQTECQSEFVRLGGVPRLKTLMNSENALVQRETARLLANMLSCDAMDEELAAFVTSDALLSIVLDKWIEADDVRLQTLAHRARSNQRYQVAKLKSRDTSSAVKYVDGVHPLHFSAANSEESTRSDYDVDVVFIHGLLGCPYETWVCGEDQDTVWAQQWLLDDLKREGHNPRILSVGYDSQLLASESVWQTMCFEDTSSEILSKLRAAQVGTGDRPVVFVTHSLGGVILKQVLLDSASAGADPDEAKLVDNVNGVVFYGVPHHGSPIAQTIQTIKPRRIAQHPVTEHLHGTPHLEMLNEWCGELFHEKDIPALSIGESSPCRLPVIGIETLVVPQESANPGFGDFIEVSDATHVDVCKPSSPEDVRYTLAHEFIAKHAPRREQQTSVA